MAITISTIVIVPGIGVGPGGVRDSVRYLADNDWLEISVQGGQTDHAWRIRKDSGGRECSGGWVR